MHNIIHKQNFDNRHGDISSRQAKKGVTKRTWPVTKWHNRDGKPMEKTLDGCLAWKMLYHKYLLKQSTEERRIKI